MKKKKVLIVAIVVSMVWLFYEAFYPISDIEQFAEELNGPGGVAEAAEYIQTVHIEGTNRYLVFLRTIEGSSRIQYSTFKKAPLLNRYEYKGTYSGSNPITHQPVQTDQGEYTVLVGENINRKLDHIEFTLYDEVYQIDVADEDFFVWYQKEPGIEEKRTKMWDNVYEMKLFDRNDEELKYEDFE
ncbi:hypothetical protein [Pseudalkalibacillus sp. SCS-8]|uniref:hypothetical protein n=1 Tax=Pseudalkalibacillus nanhaiensis TaxID=3115291 RepID=UPI0032DA92FB